jgi:excinuclease ABC subunit A
MEQILAYYTSQSPITDPGPHAALLDDLPADISELFAVIQGVLLHRNSAKYYGVQRTTQQNAEMGLRTMQQRLARIQELDPAPLTVPRDPSERQVALCRDFAVFLTTILRHQGIPARMRVGFAAYFPDSPWYGDHWITEYWNADQSRWVLVDADLGGMPKDAFKKPLKCDLTNLLPDRDFYVAGSAWRLAREGKVKSTFFRYSERWKGFPCIRGNLLHDFQSLNKLEMRIFDYFDDLHRKPEHQMTVEDKALRALFDELPRTRQILAQLGLLEETRSGQPADPEALKPSGAEQLAALGGQLQTAKPHHFRTTGIDVQEEGGELPFTPDTGAFSPPPGMDDIRVRGARQHNLKNLTIRIPRNKLVVVTGVSGSGKSSLAFDTLYAEGQRRYVESLSAFARQFMEQMEKPQVDQITGLNPAIAIEQKTITRNPRSTVGTVTEVLDYLRVLYARLGTPHCPICGQAVQPQGAQQIANQLAALPPGTHFQLLAPIAHYRKGTHLTALKDALGQGFSRARVDGEVLDIDGSIKSGKLQLDKNKKHSIELVVDRLRVPTSDPETADFRTRLMDSVETSLEAGEGVVMVAIDRTAGNDGLTKGYEFTLSEHNACPSCNLSFSELQPTLFSFNSPTGMCDECNGLGVVLQVDPGLIITRPDLSLLDGASRWHGDLRKKGAHGWHVTNLKAVADHYGVDLDLPWNELPEKFRKVILYGSEGERVRYTFQSESASGSWRGESNRDVKGILYHINRLFRQTKSEGTRRWYLSFMSQLPCPKCHGERLCAEARFVTVAGKRLPELSGYSIAALHQWISSLPTQLDEEQMTIGKELIQEIRQRLGFLRNVGLYYLTLDRSAPTLSGGEGQRIRLASQIGSGLVGVLYILDEPSIGLHTRDHRALLDTLIQLRDLGNTVLVVEHDAATMRTADWLIDLGPGPGILGGELVAEGSPEEVMANPDSLTGQYLAGKLQVTAPNGLHRRAPHGWLTIHGARLHNLKNLVVRFPLGALICITGVSGSGKSSLIAQTLYPALMRTLHNSQVVPGAHNQIEGLEQLDKVVNITQEPIGRNPRSNPGTYVGAMDEIRQVFALTPQARALGFGAGRFSFNVKGGRCEACAGYGSKKVEMHFLPDVWVKCKECNGKRFNHQTLDITFKGKNIADVLDMDVQEALEFFAPFPRLKHILQTLHDVGLDYVKLGQSALTLSGGEAQRVKLAKELSAVATGRTIYILDEPTTGLHFADIQRLLDVLHRLTDAGNTVLVIEHNLDVVKTADWVIDLGPEGGEEGGYIVAEGTPEQVARVEASYTGRFLQEVLASSER